jgi:hypothetical protein
MSDRSLRGTRLGGSSMETEEGVELAPRQLYIYECPQGHVTKLPFAAEADVPALWECRCGAEALLRDGEVPEAKAVKPARTHWDMLLERRSIDDLEVLLEERLTKLRNGTLHQRRSA